MTTTERCAYCSCLPLDWFLGVPVCPSHDYTTPADTLDVPCPGCGVTPAQAIVGADRLEALAPFTPDYCCTCGYQHGLRVVHGATRCAACTTRYLQLLAEASL